MKRGPHPTLSGYPLLSEEDMAYHRATGDQIPKSEEDRLEYAKAHGITGKGPPVDYIIMDEASELKSKVWDTMELSYLMGGNPMLREGRVEGRCR